MKPLEGHSNHLHVATFSEQDILGAEFYCKMLQDNYRLLCRSLILDKTLLAQLLNRCHFTMDMIKDIKSRSGFGQKVQRLVDYLRTRIQQDPVYMDHFCQCLHSVGQGPLARHFNTCTKHALEKKISEAKFKLRRKSGVFLTNPYDDSFAGRKGNLSLKPVRVHRKPQKSTVARPNGYLFPPTIKKGSAVPQRHYPWSYRHHLFNNTDRAELKVPLNNKYKDNKVARSFSIQNYDILAMMVRQIESQDKQIEAIKQRLRLVEIDQMFVKGSVGQTVRGSRAALNHTQHNSLPSVYPPAYKAHHH